MSGGNGGKAVEKDVQGLLPVGPAQLTVHDSVAVALL